jgi:hypothetical protein
MINFKKGPALSLHQTNYVAPVGPESITAGMVVRISGADGLAYRGFSNGSGGTITAGAGNYGSGAIYGIAINSSTSGDVIESGKIGIYALDGATALETDQYTGTPTVGQYVTTNAAGQLVAIADAAGATGAGTAIGDSTTAALDTPKIIGQVIEGVHTLENKATAAFGTGNFQTSVNVITIKLAI